MYPCPPKLSKPSDTTATAWPKTKQAVRVAIKTDSVLQHLRKLVTCFPVYSLATGVSKRSRCASCRVATPLSSRPNRRQTSITRRKAPRVSTCPLWRQAVRRDGKLAELLIVCVVCSAPRPLTSILARVWMCSGWSLRSFPKAVRRVA